MRALSHAPPSSKLLSASPGPQVGPLQAAAQPISRVCDWITLVLMLLAQRP
jgi:hypothetical protein